MERFRPEKLTLIGIKAAEPQVTNAPLLLSEIWKPDMKRSQSALVSDGTSYLINSRLGLEGEHAVLCLISQALLKPESNQAPGLDMGLFQEQICWGQLPGLFSRALSP